MISISNQIAAQFSSSSSFFFFPFSFFFFCFFVSSSFSFFFFLFFCGVTYQYRALHCCFSRFETCDVLQWEVVSLSPNPQPGGLGLSFYDLRRQGSPAIPPALDNSWLEAPHPMLSNCETLQRHVHVYSLSCVLRMWSRQIETECVWSGARNCFILNWKCLVLEIVLFFSLTKSSNGQKRSNVLDLDVCSAKNTVMEE